MEKSFPLKWSSAVVVRVIVRSTLHSKWVWAPGGVRVKGVHDDDPQVRSQSRFCDASCVAPSVCTAEEEKGVVAIHNEEVVVVDDVDLSLVHNKASFVHVREC